MYALFIKWGKLFCLDPITEWLCCFVLRCLAITFTCYFTTGITIDLPIGDFRNKTDEDLAKVFEYLEKVDTGKRECRCLLVDPPVFVYMFQLSEQTANSSLSINVWDWYARFNSSKDQPILDADNVQVDLAPFFIDNIELACTRPADPLLSSVMTGLETAHMAVAR